MRIMIVALLLSVAPAFAKGHPYQDPACPSGPVTWTKAEAAKHPMVKYSDCVVIK